MRRILVTGGAGFIGSHTVDLLLANGMKVVVYDNLVSGKLSYLKLDHPHLQFIEGDVLDYSSLRDAIIESDAVLHLAALPSVPKSIDDPIQSLQVNTQGLLHVLQAIREVNPEIRLVYASSAAVYGNSVQLPCSDEVHLPDTILSPYALEKANNERYASLFNQLFKIKAVGLRYFNVYGVRQDPNSPYSGVIAKFIERYETDKTINIYGNGSQSRDFIHVSDVAQANLLALQSDYCGVLNVATGVPETLLNLVHYIEKVGGKPAQLDFTAERAGDIAQSYAKIDKTSECLSFHYDISLAQGIQSLLKQTAGE